MSDTYKSRDDLLTAFADNTTGDITPQDMRDFIVSVMGEYGFLRASAGEHYTTVGTSLAELKVFDVAGVYDHTTLDTTNGRITVGTTGTYVIEVSGYWSGSSGHAFVVGAYKNGSANDLGIKTIVRSSSDLRPCAFAGIAELTAGDYVSLFAITDAAGQTLAVKYPMLSVRRIK